MLRARIEELEEENSQLQTEAEAAQQREDALYEQIETQAARIRDLEAALTPRQARDLRAQGADKPETQGPTGARRRMYGVGSGSLAIDKQGLSRYYGDTTQSEVWSRCLRPTFAN